MVTLPDHVQVGDTGHVADTNLIIDAVATLDVSKMDVTGGTMLGTLVVPAVETDRLGEGSGQISVLPTLDFGEAMPDSGKAIEAAGWRIGGVGAPAYGSDAANKDYVDGHVPSGGSLDALQVALIAQVYG